MSEHRAGSKTINELTDRWAWTIGGVVDNDERVVHLIIKDYLGLPLPDHWEKECQERSAREEVYRQRRLENLK